MPAAAIMTPQCQVGAIAQRGGVPFDVDQWGWTCGFYPGSEPSEYLNGTAATFADARDHSARRGGTFPVSHKAWRLPVRRFRRDDLAYPSQPVVAITNARPPLLRKK